MWDGMYCDPMTVASRDNLFRLIQDNCVVDMRHFEQSGGHEKKSSVEKKVYSDEWHGFEGQCS
ncbi:hypothetical protein ACQY0O_008394 [Thecaphora frezii]